MWREVFGFEVRYQLRQPLFYISAAVLFLLALGLMSTPVAETLSGVAGGVQRNAPALLFRFMAVFSILGLFVVTAFVTSSVLRDFELGTHPFFFSRPIRKFDYLFGRFMGSMVVSGALLAFATAGMYAALFVPWQDPATLGAVRVFPYVAGFALISIPNLLVMGACLFAIAVWGRRALWTYLFVVFFMVIQDVIEDIAKNVDSTLLGSLLEPTGLAALRNTTRYWTGAEMNALMPEIGGELLLNRVAWLAAAALVLAVAYWRFSYSRSARGARKPAAAPVKTAEAQRADVRVAPAPAGPPPPAPRRFALSTYVTQWAGQMRLELAHVLKGVPFIVLIMLGLVFVFTFAMFIGQNRGTPVWPVTHLMLQALQISMGTFLTVTLIFYSGELVWRERALRFSGVYDALPAPNAVFLLAKLSALVLVTALFLLAGIVTTVGVQLARGYTHLEPALYAKGFFVTLWPFAVLAAAALFLQVLAGNKYLGFLLTILLLVFRRFAPSLGLEHDMLGFGAHPPMPYSDLNGYGAYVAPFAWLNTYWSLAAVLLLMGASLLWMRGPGASFARRLASARARWTGGIRVASLATAAAFIACGGWVFYNTAVLNEFVPRSERLRRAAAYEKRYADYRGMALPSIALVQTEIDLFPETRSLHVKGRYELVNRSDTPIRSIPVTTRPTAGRLDVLPFRSRIDIASITLPAHTLRVSDDRLGFRVYDLDRPLEPGGRMEMAFELAVEPKGFKVAGIDQRIVGNGTFFANKNVFPQLGYLPGREIRSARERRKRGLSELLRANPIGDVEARRTNYLAADWTRYETTLSTSADQTAFGPGRLERSWEEDGRRHFHYVTDAPVIDLAAFVSGRYEVARDRWGDVDLEVYYHADHAWNVERMLGAAKKTLDYCSQAYSPYPHSQLRIVEVPNYIGLTAMALGGMIPFSESWGFISRVQGEALDYVTNVTAHEVAHQWWNHQVIPADVQGATFVSETMAQYTALMVMEQEASERDLRRLMRYELDRYLEGRSREQIGERPLSLVENQPYLHYNKGSLVMYGIKESIGEQAVNLALKGFLEANAFTGPPYPVSTELIERMRPMVAPERRGQFSDALETITLFDNRVTEVACRRTSEGDYALDVDVVTRKMRADPQGVETEIPMDDLVDVVVYGEDEHGAEIVLLDEPMRATTETRRFEVRVGQRPVRVAIDPFYKLIDRVPRDNSKPIREITGPA